MSFESVVYEVFWNIDDAYAGCCGHQHADQAEAKQCRKDTKAAWPGHMGQIVPQEKMMEVHGRGDRA